MLTQFPLLRNLLLAALVLFLNGCNKDAPRYALTADEQAWAAVYHKDDVWAFRNPSSGYERRYRVTEFKEQMQAMVYSAPSWPADYYQQLVHITFHRKDTTASRIPTSLEPYDVRWELTLEAKTKETDARLVVNSATWLPIPVGNLEQGLSPGAAIRVLPTFAAANGRTYQTVLELQPRLSYRTERAWDMRRVYYTKADGILQFEEFGGNVWVRP